MQWRKEGMRVQYGVPRVQADFVGVFKEWEGVLFVEDPGLPFG